MTFLRNKPHNIFLIGPMGVGKTTIGRQLARDLGLDFYDSDQEIENKTGADISWIFDVEGERGFRRREASVIEELTLMSNIVLATGGGSVLCERNQSNLSSRGIVIFLDTSVDLQLNRTSQDKKRPLLQQDNRREILENLRDIRLPIYTNLADITIFVGDTPSRKIVSSICKRLDHEGYLV